MSTASLQITPNLVNSSPAAIPARRLLRAYFIEAKYEFIRMLRIPSFAIPFLALPALLLILFGVVIFGGAIRSDPDAGRFLFTAFAVLGIMGPGMFGFGMGLAVEREQGLLKLKRALPMPPASYLLARMAMCILIGMIVMVSLAITAVTLMHLNISFVQFLNASILCILGTLPFSAIGLLLGVWTTARTAPAFVNLFYQVMMHLSGLYYPLPKFLRTIAPIWPSFHLQQLTMSALGGPSRGSNLIHAAVLAVLTVVFTILAVRRLKKVG